MKWTKLAISLAVLGALAAGVFFMSRYVFDKTIYDFVDNLAYTKPGQERIDAIIDPKEIVEIKITNPSGSVTFKREGPEEWSIIEPFQAEADFPTVETMADTLAFLKDDDVVEEKAADISAYNLANPDVKVKFKIAGSENYRSIYFGRRSPIDGLYYTLNPDTGKVFFTDYTVKFDFNGTAQAYVNKQIFKNILREADRFSILMDGIIYEFHKEGKQAKWFFDKPVPGKASQQMVPSTLSWIKNLIFSSIILPGELPENTGFDNPFVKIEIVKNGEWSETLIVGDKVDERLRLATRTSDDAMFLIKIEYLDMLRDRIADFGANLALFFPGKNVKRMELVKGKSSLVFTRETRGSKWVFESDKQAVVDHGTITDFIFKLRRAKNLGMLGIDATVDGAQFGLNPPKSTVKLEFFSEKYPPVEFHYGKNDPKRKFTYYYSSVDPYVIKVEGMYSDFIPDSPDGFFKKGS